jgi:hypothetical protein
MKARGQAIIEAAFVAPVVILFVVSLVGFWLALAKMTTYTSVASAVAETIGRSGAYTTTIRDQARAMLDGALGVSAAETRLHILVIDQNGDVIREQGDRPGEQEGGDDGWNTMFTVAPGDRISVDIWSPWVFDFGLRSFTFTPAGHAIMPAIGETP